MIRPCLAMQSRGGRLGLAFPRRWALRSEAVLTRCAIRLATIRGAWTDDTRLGLPLVEWSLPPEDVEIQAQVSRQLGAVEGVLRVLEVAVDRSGDQLAIAARVLVSDDGAAPVEAVVGDLGIWEGYAPGAWFAVLQIGHRQIVPGVRA